MAPTSTETDPLITTEDFAELVRTKPSTVRYWRHIGYGPKGFKIGRRVLYPQSEVSEFIAAARANQGGIVRS